ncbi:MAG: BACON domain-containing protein, partial [Planctomycetota bacterium]
GRVDMGADEFCPLLSPAYLGFYADKGRSNPEAQLLHIRYCGAGTLSWEIEEGCEWLRADPNSGECSSGEVNDVNVVVDISGLKGGIYDCNLTVTDPCASNNPQTAVVRLYLNDLPHISASPQSIGFSALEGGQNPQPQILSVSNSAAVTLNWEIMEDCNWLTVEPNCGSSTGEIDEVNVNVDIGSLTAGTYYSQLTVCDPCADNSPQTVEVSLYISEDCFPRDHPDYNGWVSVGYPQCWCYPRQCHGDADNEQQGCPKCSYYYVWAGDLNALVAGWKQAYGGSPLYDPWICADFDHHAQGDPKSGYFRVWADDLNILIANWRSNPEPNCP